MKTKRKNIQHTLINDWEMARVEDIFEVYGGSTPSTAEKKYWNGKINWVTPIDVTSLVTNNFIAESERQLSDLAIKESSLKILDPFTLLITTRATIGFTVLAAKQLTINQGMTALIPRERKKIDMLFYAYYLRSLRPYLMQLGPGSTFKEISRSTIKRLRVPMPPLSEQKKIAEILSTVDEAIGKVDRAIERTVRLNKGLLNVLLTGKWEEVRVEEIFEVYGGTTPSTNVKQYWNGEMDWVTPTDMTKFIKGNFLVGSERRISNHAVKKCSMRILEPSTLLLTTRATIGFTALNTNPITINQGITALIPKEKSKVSTSFYSFFMQSLEPYLMQLGAGSTFKEISRATIKRLRIPLPPIADQKKIAEILSTIDDRLEFQRQKKLRLSTVKTGLMNDLLTGKKRVKEG